MTEDYGDDIELRNHGMPQKFGGFRVAKRLVEDVASQGRGALGYKQCSRVLPMGHLLEVC